MHVELENLSEARSIPEEMPVFQHFADMVAARYEELLDADELFVVDLTSEELWETYINSFPEGTNPIYRERTEHDCSTCRSFIKHLGAVVRINVDGSLSTVWDVEAEGHYQIIADAMAKLVRSASIRTIFRKNEPRYGCMSNVEIMPDGHAHTWRHFHGAVPSKFYAASTGELLGTYQNTFKVFRRGLDELSTTAMETVLELIDSNNLYRGSEFKRPLKAFLDLKDNYDGTEIFVWQNINNPAARFRNTVIGTLIQDLSEGMALEAAVRSFESKVAPQNYKRTTALITPGMIKQAVAKLDELGLNDAIRRRYARLEDVSVNNVLFVDNTVRNKMKDSGIAAMLMQDMHVPMTPHNAQDISAEDFFNNVIPEAQSISLHLENSHLSNFVSLTAPEQEDINRLFQWSNDFAWSYDGDVTDSIKERVKKAGGNINALMRVSLSWYNGDDLDLHCINSSGQHIYFGYKAGILDVDMNAGGPTNPTDPVENLAFNKLSDGVYKIWVNQYNKRSNQQVGFEVEYEYAGEVKTFSYDRTVNTHQDVQVCEIEVRGRQVVSVRPGPHVRSTSSPTAKWGLKTNQMVSVEVIMLSPNYWDEQANGNKHHFFFLKDCKNPGETRGIYNEFLRSDLTPHRKVFEVLGSKTMCPSTDTQLSGVGFSSTRKDVATFVVTHNNTPRTYKVHF